MSNSVLTWNLVRDSKFHNYLTFLTLLTLISRTVNLFSFIDLDPIKNCDVV